MPAERQQRGSDLPRACAETRASFDAWEGDELDRAERARFEEHLSSCRECSRALAQFEYVSLRLRQSFEWVEPPADFTHRVMDQVRRHAALEDLQSPEPGFTERLRGRLGVDAPAPERPAGSAKGDRDSARSRRILLGRSAMGRAAVLLSAALLLVAAILVFGGTEARGPSGQGGDAAWTYVEGRSGDRLALLGRAGEAERPLAAQSPIGAPAELTWSGQSMRIAGRVELELTGDGRLELLAADRLRLERGSLQLIGTTATQDGAQGDPGTSKDRAHELRCELPCGLELLRFEGRVALLSETVHVRSQDELLLEVPLERVTVRVLEGRAELRSEERGEPVELEPGLLLIAEPLQPLRVIGRDALRTHQLTDVGEPGGDPRRDFVVRGFVRAADQRPVAGARVELRIGGQRREAFADERGSYELRLPLDPGLSAPGLVVASAPAQSGAVQAGGTGTERLRTARALLGQVQRPETQRRDLVLGRPDSLAGRLLDGSGAPLGGASVELLRFDTLLNRAERVGGAESADDGSFTITGLPELEVGESFAALVEPKDRPIFAWYAFDALARGGLVEMRAPQLRDVQVPLQHEHSRLVWIERRPSGPLAAHVLRLELHRVEPGQRQVSLRAVRGQDLVHWEDEGQGKPQRLHLQSVDFASGQVESLVRERLRVVSTTKGPLGAGKYRLVRRSDGAVIAEGTIQPGGAIDLSLPLDRRALALSLDQGQGWHSFALGAGGVAERYQLVEQVPTDPMQDPRVAAAETLGSDSGEGRFGPAPDVYGDPGTGEGTRRLELRLSEGGAVITGAQLFAQIGSGQAFLAGWSDYDGRIVLPALPAVGELTVLALDAEGTALRVGRELFDLRQVEAGVYAIDLAPVRWQILGQLEGAALQRAEERTSVRALLLDGSFRGMEYESQLGPDGSFTFSLVPQGRLRIEVAGLEREIGPRARHVRFD